MRCTGLRFLAVSLLFQESRRYHVWSDQLPVLQHRRKEPSNTLIILICTETWEGSCCTEVIYCCVFGFPTTEAVKKGMSVISPIAPKNSVSAVMYHYTIKLLIPDKKTFLQEIKVGDSLLKFLSLVSLGIYLLWNLMRYLRCELSLPLGIGYTDSHMPFLYFFSCCFW